MPKNRHEDLSGQRFNDLVVLNFYDRRSGIDKRKFYIRWWCKCCGCGYEFAVRGGDLRSGRKKACKYCTNHPSMTYHGMSNLPEYSIWLGMKQRCTNPNSLSYDNYGAIGVKICQRWLDSFEDFYIDMGTRPSLEHTLDRFDNDGDYCPENVFWSTPEEQANNKSSNHVLYHNGEFLTVMQWSRKLGINVRTILSRLNKGKSEEEALSLIDHRTNEPLQK